METYVRMKKRHTLGKREEEEEEEEQEEKEKKIKHEGVEGIDGNLRDGGISR